MGQYFDFTQLEGLWPDCIYGALEYDPTTSQKLVTDYASQFSYFDHRRKATRILISGGERSGKTMTMVAISCERIVPLIDGEIWIIGGDYFHTRVEFDLIAKVMSALGILKDQFRPREGSWEMRLTTGTVITTRTSYDTAKIAAVSLDGVIMCEVGKQTEEAWRKARGRVIDRQGWVIGSGTIEEGFQWWNDILESWQYTYETPLSRELSDSVAYRGAAFFVPTWTNNRVFVRDRHPTTIEGLDEIPSDQNYVWVDHQGKVVESGPDGWPSKSVMQGDEDLRKPQLVLLNQVMHDERASMAESRFWERYGAIPSKPTNLVIPNFEHAIHVRDLEIEIDGENRPLPVELWIDPGHKVYSVLMVQIVSQHQVNIVDELYFHNAIAEDVIPDVMSHPLWGYVAGGVIDFAGRQHAATKSQIERWWEMAGINLDSERWPMEDTWEIVRYWLQRDPETLQPRLLFNSTLNSSRHSEDKAGGILTEFGMWRWPKRSVSRNAASRPIDNNNHSIKALAYGLLFRFGPTGRRSARERGPMTVVRRSFTYGRRKHG